MSPRHRPILSITLPLLLLACGEGDPPQAPDAAADAGPADARADAPGDAAPDGLTQLTVTLGQPGSSSLAIGRHVVVPLTLSGAPRPFALTAAPCLLKLKGQGSAPSLALKLDLAQGAKAELVIFAPPDARPGASCSLASTDLELTISPLSLTVAAPTYAALSLGNHAVSAISGLRVTTVGQLSAATRRPRALTWAGGGFGGAWFAVIADHGDTAVTVSQVRLYRFTVKSSGPLAPWLNLAGKSKSPTAVEDMIWSPVGPCPGAGQDALYLGAAAADDPGASGGLPGGIYCVSPQKQLSTIYDNKARTLDADPAGGFIATGAKGALYVSRWGGYEIYPGGALLTDPAFPFSCSGHLRFARGGPHRGHLYMIGVTAPRTLLRVSPTPHKAVNLGDLSPKDTSSDYNTPALSHGGSFGELVLVPRHDPANWGSYALEARFAQAGKLRQLELVKKLRCGRKIAFDAAGQQLAVITTATSTCSGALTAHVFSFDLP